MKLNDRHGEERAGPLRRQSTRAGMQRRHVLLIAMAVAAPMMFSCGGSGEGGKSERTTTPASLALAKTWAEERAWNAIASHGTAIGDEWTSAYWAPDREREVIIKIKGLHAIFVPLTGQTTESGRNGEWKGQVAFSAQQHRFANDSAGQGASDWIEGPGPIGSTLLFLRRKKSGAIVWATAASGSPPVEDRHYSPDEKDVLATVLQSFQHPDTPPERRATSHNILAVLSEDARILREVGGGVDKPAGVNALYIARAAAVDLSHCPEDFADAYRTHLDAWRKGEKALIESTWSKVAEIANRNGVGTYQ